MATISVHTAFTIQLKNGTKIRYPVGVHKDVDPEVASHWYAQHFIGEGSATQPEQEKPQVISPPTSVVPVSVQRLAEKRRLAAEKLAAATSTQKSA